MMAGQYQQQPTVPYTPGMEYSGDVLWAGADVTSVGVGDRVYVDIFNAGPRSYDPRYQNGGFASFAVAPHTAVRQVPETFTYDEAATFCGAYETSWHCLFKCAKLQAGETVLIHGATGGTGSAAVQLAAAAGAKIIITGGCDDKLATVRAGLGGDSIIASVNYRKGGGEQGGFKEAVREATNGKGVDVVFDSVGGSVSLESLRCIKFGGRFLIVGWTATPFAGGGRGAGASHSTANVLPTNLVMMKGLHVIGCPVAIHTRLDPSIRAERVASIDAWVTAGLLRPTVSMAFDLVDCKEALMSKWERKVTGNCVVHPPPADHFP